MQKLLLGYRDNMRVEIETGVAVTAKTESERNIALIAMRDRNVSALTYRAIPMLIIRRMPSN
jgi:hypothetical protein